MADDTVDVKLGAHDAGMKAGLNQGAQDVEGFAAKVTAALAAAGAAAQASMEKINHSVSHGFHEASEGMEGFLGKMEKMQKFMMLVAEFAALGIVGEKVHELAEHFAEYGDNVEKATMRTGLASDELQKLYFAGRMSDVGMEQMNGALTMLSRQMAMAQAGSERAVNAFKAVGISAEELKGIKLDDALGKIADSFQKHADGANKSAAATALFRGEGQALLPMLDQGGEKIRELMQQAEDLGLVMGEDDIKAAAELDTQFKILGAQTQALGLRVGAQLAPAMMQITDAMMEASKKGGILEAALDGLAAVFKAFMSVVLIVIGGLKQLGQSLGAMAAAIAAAIRGDWTGALGILKDGFHDIQTTGTQTWEAVAKVWSKNPVTAHEGEHAKKPQMPVPPMHGKNALDEAKKLADAIRNLQKAETEAELNLLKQHLDESQTLYDQAYADGLVTIQEYYDARLKITETKLDAEIDAKKKEIAAAEAAEAAVKKAGGKHMDTQVIQERTKIVQLTGQLRLLEDQRATAAVNNAAQMTEAEKKLGLELTKGAIDTQKTVMTAGIEDRKAMYESQFNMGLISKERLIDLERDLVDQQYQIDRDAIQREIELNDQADYKNPAKVAALNSKLIELDRAYRSQILQNTIQMTEEVRGPTTQMFTDMRQGFSSGLATMLDGTKGFGAGIRDIFMSVLQAFDKMIAEKVTKWLMGEIQQTAASVTGNATRTAAAVGGQATQTAVTAAAQAAQVGTTVTAETAKTGAVVAGNAARTASGWLAATESVAATAWAAIKNIATAAWQAAASVYASIAAIPYVGPFLAPAMAIGAAATVIGFVGHISSAEGGYDIPAGTNPITQLHEQEMVLPKAQADVIRRMASNATGDGARSGGDTHVHIHAVDAASFERRLMQSGGTLQAMLREAQRNGVATGFRNSWGSTG